MKRLIATTLVALTAWTAPAQEVTLGSLLEEMVARKNMARYPEPAYQTRQFSSYDRRAKEPGGENWYANRDNTKFLRRELTENGEEWVMFDARSPGAIVRWWMTFGGFVEGAGKGIIRVYIDGAEEPVIEGTAFDVLSGGRLVGPPLSASVSELTPYQNRGHNLYLPIPYGKSCKITYQGAGITANDEGEITDHKVAVYYVINYREYAPDVEVASFDSRSLTKYASALNKAQLTLAMPFQQLLSQQPQKAFKMRKLRPGESMSLNLEGEQYLKTILMKLEADSLSQALRSTILSFSFDGRKTLSVPVGDFFGTGYEINPYETFYTKVYQDGVMASAWPMPFQSSASLQISNIGDQVVKIQDLRLYVDEWRWDDRSMYFGGSWKQFYDKETGGPDNPEDLVFNTLEGKGVYAGDLVTLYNSASAWWGEGDEKIYVDGEAFPSHFGTGTEDYYGYAWARPEGFDHPFIAQPDGSGNLEPGTTVNIRFRGLDRIPFTQRLKMTMELWHWTQTPVDYAPTTFFYLRPGGESGTIFREEEAKRPVKLREEKINVYHSLMESGKIQGEHLEPVRVDAGLLGPQAWKGSVWDGDAHLWWRRAKEGDVLYLQFISEKAYPGSDLELQLTQAKDYGIVGISLNEGPQITFDGYAPEVSVEKTQMENADIRKGINTLKVVVKGKNDKALEGNMFGIDYIRVK